MHSNWRGSQEWRRLGMPLTTGSEEACKLYDAIVTQTAGFYEDESVGGVLGALSKLQAADPNFVMGQVLANGLQAMGTKSSLRLDPSFQASIDQMVKLAKDTDITERERKHAYAVKLFAEGHTGSANRQWAEILLDHPTDMLALKSAHYGHFYMGQSNQIKDNVGRVLPYWKPEMPLYGYVLGMYAFGLEETNLYQEAEANARKALEMNPRDGWSTHVLCHVMESTGRQEEGIKMLDDTNQFWTTCGAIANHNYWHQALYYVELGDYKAALSIFDDHIKTRAAKTQMMLDIVDMTSLLFRLQMEGVNVGDRWDQVHEYCKTHLHDHIFTYNDVHLLLSCLGSGNKEAEQEMMSSMETFLKEGQGHNRDVVAEVGHAICQALVAYNDGDFAAAVDLFAPIRYKVVNIGGSHAQRDLLNLFLIQAAIKSPEKKHHKLARSLVNERKVWKPNAPMTDRLMAKTIELHAD